MSNFEIKKCIGEGSFGKVFLVKRKENNQVYAMKILNKDEFIDPKHKSNLMSERNIMSKIDYPFIVKLHQSFQTPWKLFFLMDFLNGGELFYHLKWEKRFTENKARFYAAEITLALSHLHKNGIVYRDLKPENVLLDISGHLWLTDFGLSKMGIMGNKKVFTFCGTPEYLAPEIIQGKGYTKAVDWWSLGLLLFEMLSGRHPFKWAWFQKNLPTEQLYKEITDVSKWP